MKQELLDALLEEYQESTHKINIEDLKLLYPSMLVRVLPKTMVSIGNIILTDARGAAGTPLYEGIVIRTYDPKPMHWKRESVDLDALQFVFDQIKSQIPLKSVVFQFEKLLDHECRRDIDIVIESDFKFGDHVLFPHWSGEPMHCLERGIMNHDLLRYRLIPDYNVISRHPGNKEYGGPVCWLKQTTDTIDGIMQEILDSMYDPNECTFDDDVFITRVKERFDIVPKVTKRITGI
jgi:hypothetical protein